MPENRRPVWVIVPVRITPPPHQKHDLTIYRKSSYSSPSLLLSFAHTIALLIGIWSARFSLLLHQLSLAKWLPPHCINERVVFLAAACQSTPFVLHKNHFQTRAFMCHVQREMKNKARWVFLALTALNQVECASHLSFKCRHMATLHTFLSSFSSSNLAIVTLTVI